MHVLRIHLDGQESDLAAFFGYLAHLCATENDEGDTRPNFGRSDASELYMADVSFSSRINSNRPVIGAPLIDGKFFFKRRSHSSQRDEVVDETPSHGSDLLHFIGHAEIALNPTRAYVHQQHERRNPRARRRVINLGTQSEPRINLYTRELPEFDDERPINPMDDNVLIGDLTYPPERYGSFENFTNEYIRAAFQTLENHLIEASDFINDPVDGGAVFMRSVPTINIKQVETYWTLPSPTPFNELMQIEPRFRALGASSQRRIYANVVSDLETEQNVPCIATRISSGLRAKLYPKTNRSLRFELTHDLRHCASLGAHTFDGENTLDDALSLLERCREHAQEQAIILADHLAADEENERHRTPYELVTHIVRACGSNSRLRELLLEIIIHNGRYTTVPNDELRRAIRTLVNRGVVQRIVRNGRTVRLTSEYEQARQILANHAPITTDENMA